MKFRTCSMVTSSAKPIVTRPPLSGTSSDLRIPCMWCSYLLLLVYTDFAHVLRPWAEFAFGI